MPRRIPGGPGRAPGRSCSARPPRPSPACSRKAAVSPRRPGTGTGARSGWRSASPASGTRTRDGRWSPARCATSRTRTTPGSANRRSPPWAFSCPRPAACPRPSAERWKSSTRCGGPAACSPSRSANAVRRNWLRPPALPPGGKICPAKCGRRSPASPAGRCCGRPTAGPARSASRWSTRWAGSCCGSSPIPSGCSPSRTGRCWPCWADTWSRRCIAPIR